MIATVRRIGPGLLLYAAMAAFAVWHLRRVEQPPVPGLARWAVFAALPALVAVVPGTVGATRRLLIALVPYTVAAVGLATGHWPFRPHLLGSGGYFARSVGDVHDGLSSWVSTVLPYDAAKTPELRVVVVLSIAVLLAALAAVILVWRSALPAIVLAFVPFLVVSTVFSLDRPALRAAIMLALSLAALAILGGRGPSALRVATAALVVGLATAFVAIPGVAKGEFVDWRHIGQAQKKGASVAFVWNQNYGPLIRPKKPIVLLKVDAGRPSYWRVAVLDYFDGIKWVEEPANVTDAAAPDVTIPADQLPADTVGRLNHDRLTARFTNMGWSTTALAAPPVAVAYHGLQSSLGAVRESSLGTLNVEHPVAVGGSWSVDYVPPRPSLTDLVAAGAAYPTSLSRDLQLTNERVEFPAWGTPGREAAVTDVLNQHFFGDALVDWQRVYVQARRLTRTAESPYEAAAAIEQYFHDTYSYSEKADFSQAPAPLPAFFFSRARAGYCQMFSGTMAVMLRMLGIPARVAEGFATGARKPGATNYLVTDREAHAWVEVYIPTYGWLPFEPTPTRSLPYSYSTTSPELSKAFAAETRRSPGNNRLLHLRPGLGINAGTPGGPLGRTPGGTRNLREGASVAGPPPSHPWRPGFGAYALIVAGAAVLLIVLVKLLRSLRRYVRRTPESIAAAVRSDLEAYVRDQGVSSAVRSLTPVEFGRLLRREFGVDARRWSDLQSRARYGPPDGRAYDVARQARREARAVKRELRKGLARSERLRGAVRLRSLLP